MGLKTLELKNPSAPQVKLFDPQCYDPRGGQYFICCQADVVIRHAQGEATVRRQFYLHDDGDWHETTRNGQDFPGFYATEAHAHLALRGA